MLLALFRFLLGHECRRCGRWRMWFGLSQEFTCLDLAGCQAARRTKVARFDATHKIPFEQDDLQKLNRGVTWV
jgi:hypothetical protein